MPAARYHAGAYMLLLVATPAIETLIRGLPKVELHVHLEGSIGPELALVLAQRRGVRLPGMDEGVEGIRRAFRFSRFDEFIRMFVAVSSCLQEAEDFALACDGVAEELARQNVVYAEMTFTPMTHVARGVRPQEMLAGLAEGRRRAAARGVALAWVFDIVRSFPDQGEATLGLALAQRDAGVIALGVGGPEGPSWPNTPLRPWFDRARAEGLHRVPHAGEQDGPASVREAIELFSAERIGHGIRCLEDPAVVDLVRERDVALEVCPSSNVALGFVPDVASHPLPSLLAAGLRVSIGSDDPPLFGTTLVDEYLRVHQQLGFDSSRLLALARAAVEHSFLDPTQKRAITEAQKTWCEDLRS